MLLFKDRNNEMASEPARGDGSRTSKFFQQAKGACSPASLLLQQLAGYSDHHAVSKWGLEAMACELAEHLVDCQAVVLPHMVQQAQSMILCRERERQKPSGFFSLLSPLLPRGAWLSSSNLIHAQLLLAIPLVEVGVLPAPWYCHWKLPPEPHSPSALLHHNWSSASAGRRWSQNNPWDKDGGSFRNSTLY